MAYGMNRQLKSFVRLSAFSSHDQIFRIVYVVGLYGMPLVLLFRNYRYLQIFEDISNSFTDICNSFTDILKYLQISLNI